MLMPSRIALTWLQVFALTLPGFPTPVRAQQSPLARFIHQTRLDNGLDVIVVENHAVPLATVLVAVRNGAYRSEEHTSELQSPCNLVCRLLLEKKKCVLAQQLLIASLHVVQFL